jgi:hypothetical protein
VKRLFIAIAWAAALAAQQTSNLDTSMPVRQLALRADTHHVQGIDTDGTRLWVTAVAAAARKGYLFEFSLQDGSLTRSIELQDGERFHPGGLVTDSESIWIPIAEYRAHSTAVIQRRDKRTLALISQFSVADHIGCVAVTPEYVIGGNWDSKEFYVWNHDGTLVREVASQTGNAYQDLKFVSGKVVGSGTLAGRQGAVDWLELPAFQLSERKLVGNTEKGQAFTREGMTLFKGQLWFLPEDNASRLFVFPLDLR